VTRGRRQRLAESFLDSIRQVIDIAMVAGGGARTPRLSSRELKSRASTNSATYAFLARCGRKELRAEQFEEFWRIGCFAGFLVGREAAR
jgi:hypothetical protein